MGIHAHLARLALAVFVVACLAGCASRDPDFGRSGPPAPEPVQGLGVLLVQNHSDQSVFHLRWREAGSSRWSGDGLDDGDVIKPQQERQLELPAGTYHLRLELGDGGNWTPEAPLQVRAGAVVSCVLPGSAAAKFGTLTVANNSAWAILHVRFSSRNDPGWGPERLPTGEYLTAGKRRSWEVEAGQYQLQVAFQDGMTQDSAAYAVTLGKETVFRIGTIKRRSQ
ncbi:MAG: hypothetical protein JKY65_17120 [Planctomycetes bacterium]|nr:hypothetical protein [Planctomycetota bacterium]